MSVYTKIFSPKNTGLSAGLSGRQLKILRILVEYSSSGNSAVSSSDITGVYNQNHELLISAATVRADIALLESRGLVQRAARNRGTRPTLDGWAWYLRQPAMGRNGSITSEPSILRSSDAIGTARNLITELAEQWGGAILLRYPRLGSYRLADVHLLRDGSIIPSLTVACINGVTMTVHGTVIADHSPVSVPAASLVERDLRKLAADCTVAVFGQRLNLVLCSDGGRDLSTRPVFSVLSALMEPIGALAGVQKTRYRLAQRRQPAVTERLDWVLNLLDRLTREDVGDADLLRRRDPVLLEELSEQGRSLVLSGIAWGTNEDHSGYLGYLGPLTSYFDQIQRGLLTTAAVLKYHFYCQ